MDEQKQRTPSLVRQKILLLSLKSTPDIASSVTLGRHLLHTSPSRLGGTFALPTDWEAPAVTTPDVNHRLAGLAEPRGVSPSPAAHPTSLISNRHHRAGVYTNKNIGHVLTGCFVANAIAFHPSQTRLSQAERSQACSCPMRCKEENGMRKW